MRDLVPVKVLMYGFSLRRQYLRQWQEILDFSYWIRVHSINLKSFHYYDRMYPSQDVASSIGNLIALPLQGQALKNGNSAFVDENWNAYPDQWDILLNKTEKLGMEDIEKYMHRWQAELAEAGECFPVQYELQTKTMEEKM